MPRQAIAYLVVIILSAVGCLLLAANLLKVEKSWSGALTKVQESNVKNADTLLIQRNKLDELQAEVNRLNLGWDRVYDAVPTTPNRNNGSLSVRLGSNNGVAAAADGTPMTLHAFQPKGEGFIYVGPFLARSENIRADQSTLVMGWSPLGNTNNSLDPQQWAVEWAGWGAGNWRFRTQIPAEDKVRFESMANRFNTNLSTLRQSGSSIARQDELYQSAQAQLRQREQELNGSTEVQEDQVDPLRPELSIGLVNANDDEEEARNALELEVDALRRAILDEKKIEEDYLRQLRGGGPSAKATAPRIGARPK